MSSTDEILLAFAPNWLGDAVMCTPALRALKTRFGSHRFVVAGRGPIVALLRGLPWIDEFIELPPTSGLRGLSAFRRSVHPLGRPALAVVFPHSFRAALQARISGARERIGYDRNGRSFLLTEAVTPFTENGYITPVYMGREYLKLVEAVDAADDAKGPELHADPVHVERFLEHVSGDGPLIGIAPGAAFGPSKRWLPDRYAGVADALHESLGARCVLLTGPGEEDTRTAVQSSARTPLLTPVDGPPTLDGLKAAISQLDLLIGNDSGPRHVAVAFGVPVVCIMGPTSPAYSGGPFEKGAVLRVDVDCGPCQKPVCVTDHRCMTRISEARVVASALAILNERSPAV